MDGNGRWATKRGMPRKFGHREGAKNFKDPSLYCRDIGLRNASFYVFSTENWKRPQDEVDAIMDLFWDYLCEADQYLERRVRMVFVGDRSRLQDRLQSAWKNWNTIPGTLKDEPDSRHQLRRQR